MPLLTMWEYRDALLTELCQLVHQVYLPSRMPPGNDRWHHTVLPLVPDGATLCPWVPDGSTLSCHWYQMAPHCPPTGTRWHHTAPTGTSFYTFGRGRISFTREFSIISTLPMYQTWVHIPKVCLSAFKVGNAMNCPGGAAPYL